MDAYTFNVVDPDGRPSNDDGSQALSQGLRDGLASQFQLYNYPPEHFNSSPRNHTDSPYLTSYAPPSVLKSPTGGISGTMSHPHLSPSGSPGSDLQVDNVPHFLGHHRHFSDSDLGFVSRPTIHISTSFGPSASFTPSPQSAYYSGDFPSTTSSHLSSLPPTPATPYGGTEPILFQGRTLEFNINSPMIPFRYDDTLSAGIDPMLLLDPFTAQESARGRTMASERHASYTVTQKSRPRSWGPIDSDDTRQRHPVSQRVPALSRKARRPQRSRSPAALPPLTNFPLDPIDALFDNDEEEETEPSLLFEGTGVPQSESSDLAGNVTIELPLAHSTALASNRSPDSFVAGLNGEAGGSPLQERSGMIVRSVVASDDVVIASRSRRTVGGPLFMCEVEGCGRDFTAKHNLKNHMNAHYGIKAFLCEHCGKNYTTKHVLNRHSKTCKKLRTKRKGLSTKQ